MKAKQGIQQEQDEQNNSNVAGPISSSSLSSSSAAAATIIVLSTTTLYVGNLAPQVAEVHLQKLFQTWGAEVRRVHQCKHPTTGQPRGFSFVELDSLSSAETAMQQLDGKTLLGRKLTVRPARAAASTKSGSSIVENSTTSTTVTATNSAMDLKREKNSLETKIEALKRAMAEKQQKKENQANKR